MLETVLIKRYMCKNSQKVYENVDFEEIFGVKLPNLQVWLSNWTPYRRMGALELKRFIQ